MRLPRPRISTVGLMAFVAAVAVGLSMWMNGMRAGRLAQDYRAKAAELTHLEQYHRNRAADLYNQGMMSDVRRDLRGEAARGERDLRLIRRDERLAAYFKSLVRFEDAVADHYRRLAGKYAAAADSPWDPLPSDPPEPGPPPEQPSLLP